MFSPRDASSSPLPWRPDGPRSLPARPRVVLLRTDGRRPLLGDAASGVFAPSSFGLVVRHYWHQLGQRYLHVRLGPFLLTRDSLRGTLERLPLTSEPSLRPLESVTLADALGWLLRVTTDAYRRGVEVRGWPALEGPVWAQPAWDALRGET